MSLPEVEKSAPQRVLSIDALRGFDMFWITGGKPVLVALMGLFMVELPESWEYHLGHPPWEGFSAWDMIMPLFLFIVGAAMPFAFARRREAGADRKDIYLRIARRVVVLWVLGMIAQGHLLDFDRETLAVFSNTLQAIAVGYLVAGLALIHLSILGQVGLAAVMLVGYWLLMLTVPVPGHGAGVLTEQGNLAIYLDHLLLRSFDDGNTYAWLLGGMGFSAMVLSGVFAGHLLHGGQTKRGKCLGLVLLGMVSLFLGALWAGDFDGIGGVTLLGEWRFPIIKHLFTSSMVLWAAGWCYLLLALFYLLIDVWRLQRWAFFFIVIGANPIFAYMIIRFVNFKNIAGKLVGGLAENVGSFGPTGESIGVALTAVTAYSVLWLLLWYMYRNGTRIRV